MNCLVKDVGEVVKIEQIRFVYKSAYDKASISKHYFVIADTSNHCIRLLDIGNNIVMTLAGICGVSGFKDGPISKNLMDSPNSLGVDNFGNLWIYDSGNSYIRKLELKVSSKDDKTIVDGALLTTMIKGVCRDVPNNLK